MITPGICQTFLAESFAGVHRPEDDYRIALFGATAELSSATQKFATLGEVSGAGYITGGQTLAGYSIVTDGAAVVLDFNDAIWRDASITASGALIYNATRGDRAVCVINFSGPVTSTNGDFTVTFPTPTAATGLIRIL